MRKKVFAFSMTIGCMFLLGCWSFMVSAATTGTGDKETLYPKMADVKPKIDGVLDEEIWQTKPLEKEFISYSPHLGETLPYKTLVWTSYDKENLYFAFQCFDPEPDKIKTSFKRRDLMLEDDWVGLSLDSLGTKQTAWALFVNPNGIQCDILDSAVTGSNISPDLVWESAGKVTDKGYQVEICIPLRSIPFKSGEEVKMGVLFWRRVVRLGIRAVWPTYVPGGRVFGTHTSVIYKGLKKPLMLDLLPNVVYVSNQDRVNPDQWGNRDITKGIGIDAKYGFTSSITGQMTINPDFSQVESDTFQVEVNQRYPLFYNEKRPFFMEGTDIFNFFTLSYELSAFLTHPVHTRRIVDPMWGAKLTGNIGKFTFGILSAGDEQPGQPWESGENPNEGKNAFWGIARGKYSLGKDSYIGLLYSGREFAGDYNRVFGADVLYRFLTHHRLNASFLHSTSPGGNSNGGKNNNVNLSYYLHTQHWRIMAGFEHIGTDFRMDSSFLRRKGINHAEVVLSYMYRPKFKTFNILKHIWPRIQYQHVHDLDTGMNDSFLKIGALTYLAWSTCHWFDYYDKKESWMGQTFDLTQFNTGAESTLTTWLRIEAQFQWGDLIYYSGDPALKGKWFRALGLLELEPTEKLNLQFIYTHEALSKDDQKLYNVNIYWLRNTYHFNKYLLFRAMIQYNDYQKKLLTDFLASFTLIPGTVFHVGYGSLYEGREWQNNDWVHRQGDLLHFKRSFFAKISYLWRL